MTELHLFGEVDGWNLSAEKVKDFLNETEGDIKLIVASPGGSVFEGYTIYNLLKNSGRVKEAYIYGLCGSIMTLIVNAAPVIKMTEVATYMIHNPWTMMMGDEQELEKEKEILTQIKNVLMKIYVNKTGQTEEVISEWMNEEKWFNAEEAKEAGFIDEVMTDEVKAVAYWGKKSNINMNTVEQKNFFNQLLGEFKAFFSEVKGEPQNMTLTLENGQQVYVESEDEELIGKSVFLADENGEKTDEPAPDGVHILEDGRSITVAEGIITEVSEEADEEVEEMKKKIDDLEAQLAEKEEENDSVKAENEGLQAKIQEWEAKAEQMTQDLETLRGHIFGDPTVDKKDLDQEGGGSQRADRLKKAWKARGY